MTWNRMTWPGPWMSPTKRFANSLGPDCRRTSAVRCSTAWRMKSKSERRSLPRSKHSTQARSNRRRKVTSKTFVDTLRYFTDLAQHVQHRTTLAVKGHEAWTVRQPWGACAFIFPWNFPFPPDRLGDLSGARLLATPWSSNRPKTRPYRQSTWRESRRKSVFPME